MISITQNLESPAFMALVDPDCASLFRQWNVTPPPGREIDLAWQVAASRGTVKDKLLREDNIRVAVVSAASETDPLLRDMARNASQMPSHAWLHLILLTPMRVTQPFMAQLRQFASWSVLPAPCTAAELSDALANAAWKAAEQHRLAMLSIAIRNEAEDILIRTRNIVGALRNVETPAALGNLVRIADLMSESEEAHTRSEPRRRDGAAPSQASQGTPPSENIGPRGEDAGRFWTRRLIDFCTARQSFFPDGLFSDPAWDMLLDLTHARLSGKRVSVSSLCIASRVPATTALRRISDLVSEGLAARVRDEADGRRVFVELTEDGFARMGAYIENVRSMLSDGQQTQMRRAQ
ncbi:MAG: winged helix DNA-binding protein [Parvibaculum sp.]|uniref:winged helix DNA-binding protein n=1 Tax=Parvibaculum sp. TaxID=2024848 RepID=UPI002ABA29B7|nr:winged helix DNA-binding protein [Parvibaculum sp.]MDZ4380808.1 winged helix DNA-binding protein [Parvibaculum sp.]